MKTKAKRGSKGTTINISIGGAPAGGPPMPPRGPVGLGAVPIPSLAGPRPMPPAGPMPPPPGPVGPGMKRGGRIMAGAGSGLGRLRKNGCR